MADAPYYFISYDEWSRAEPIEFASITTSAGTELSDAQLMQAYYQLEPSVEPSPDLATNIYERVLQWSREYSSPSQSQS